MTTITPSSNCTITTLTAESQLLEIFGFLQQCEADTTKNTGNKDYIQGTFNFNTLTFSGNFNIPVTIATNASGLVTVVAKEYLTNSGFTNGSDGDFKSTNPAQYLIEVVTFLQNRELDATKNPSSRNYITATLDTDNLNFSGSVTLPLTMTLGTDGKISFTANEYLA